VLQRSPKAARQARWRDRHRESQRRYESRQRAGVGLFPVPPTSRDIDVLISLGYLREGAEGNREHVGEAAAAAIRELGHGFVHRDC
jgi:hypothetical protein